jgi:hypothetical protein
MAVDWTSAGDQYGTPLGASLEHLLGEFGRIHEMIRARFEAASVRADEDQVFAGLCISVAEIDAFLAMRPDEIAAVTTDSTRPSVTQRVAATVSRDERTHRRNGAASRLEHLVRSFELDALDVDLLLIALLPEIDSRYERVYGYLQNDLTRRHSSIGLAAELLGGSFGRRIEVRAHLGDGAPLRRHHLLIVLDDAAQADAPLLRRGLRVDERIVDYLFEVDSLDRRISGFCSWVAPGLDFEDLALSQETRDLLVRLSAPQNDAVHGMILYFQGPAGLGKRLAAAAMCRRRGVRLLSVELRGLLRLPEAELAANVSVILREAVLHNAVVYFESFPELVGEIPPALEVLLRALLGHRGMVALAGEGVWEPVRRPGAAVFLQLIFRMPDAPMRCELWKRELGAAIPLIATELQTLAAQFRLTPSQISAVAHSARELAGWEVPRAARSGLAWLQGLCRESSGRMLQSLAEKITPRLGWSDIVLPPDRLQQLYEVYDAARYGAMVFDEWGFGAALSLGKGLAVLFNGPSGTGKTLAAEVLAAELGMDLYRINLSTVVSKWIGETQRSLARLFAAAEGANAVLFFDEADALFGKRSEVRDSHDRYANLETAYLLQRIESYQGIAILATNLGKNIDAAFRRRLQFVIDFPLPDAAHRKLIWKRVFPAGTPVAADLDLDVVARRFELAGGNIKNIALAAAFKAAADGGVVRFEDLLHATQREYQKMGKIIRDGEFAAACHA